MTGGGQWAVGGGGNDCKDIIDFVRQCTCNINNYHGR